MDFPDAVRKAIKSAAEAFQVSPASDNLPDVSTGPRFITHYVTAIDGFDPNDETTSPEDLLKTLTDEMQLMMRAITEERGNIGMMLGDSIEAYWGAPEEMEKSEGARLACRAALRQLEAVESHNSIYKLKYGFRMGIASGEAAAGIFGDRRRQYMAVGLPVNLSRELMVACKDRDARILVNETTYELCKDSFLFEERQPIKRREQETLAKAFELKGLARG